MLLHFDKERVSQLLDNSRRASIRRPCAEQYYELRYLRDDLSAERRAQILASKDSQYGFLISNDNLDGSKIPVGLWLVGDEGVYLMSNAPDDVEPGHTFKRVMVAASECDPSFCTPDDIRHIKTVSFGGDDGTIFIEEDMVARMLLQPEVAIDLTPDRIKFVI